MDRDPDTQPVTQSGSGALVPFDRTMAAAAVADGARRYFAERRTRIKPFIDAHFSLPGTLALHRSAVGWDIARAPLNLSLAAPQLAMQVGAKAAGRFGATRAEKLLKRSILLETAVSREIEWLIHTELLELPIAQKRRESRRDALSEAIMEGPAVTEAVQAALRDIGRHGDDPAFRERLRHAMTEYGITRNAAAEITTGLLNLSAGALALNKLTPGAVSLGPALAAVITEHAAVSAFPFGGWLGGVWYGLFPVAPGVGLVMTTTGGLMIASATFAAFAGVISDPIQRATGLHRKRLEKMVGALERQFSDPAAPGFAVHDHYVARLLDLFDILGAAVRLAH
ncbi:MAG: hypothetical protein HIU92_00365 [Proteobacteria bacterium]|nr:hypothetical protein [Pseudomonadota bacterium]